MKTKAITFPAFLILLTGCATTRCTEPTVNTVRQTAYLQNDERTVLTAVRTEDRAYLLDGEKAPERYVWTYSCEGQEYLRFTPEGMGYRVLND